MRSKHKDSTRAPAHTDTTRLNTRERGANRDEYNAMVITNETVKQDETNGKIPEDGTKTSETRSVQESHSYSESKPLDKVIQPKSTPTSTVVKTLTSFAAVAAVVAVVATNNNGIEVDFAKVDATDTTIQYDINLDGYSGQENLEVVVYNDFTNRTQAVNAANISGVVEGLKPAMEYTIAVKQGYRTLGKTTLKTDDAYLTQLNGATYQCTCYIDGLFHFSLDIIDQNGYWSNYRATLTDSYGNQAQTSFTYTNAEADYTLSVEDAGLRGTNATLVVYCTTSEPDASGNTNREIEILHTTVEI